MPAIDFSSVSVDTMMLMPVIVLWLTAAAIMLGNTFFWRDKRAWPAIISLVAIVVSALFCFNIRSTYADSMTTAFADSVKVDYVSFMGNIALLVTAFLSVLVAWTYLRNKGLNRSDYYVLLLLSVSGAMLMTDANDLIVLFLGLEILSFALYALVGFSTKEARSEEASIKYFLLGAFASAFLLYGISMVYGVMQSTNLDVIFAKASQMHGFSAMLLAGVGLLLVGLGFKAALIPFHQWTPDVYDGAPTSVTAFMAAAAKIGAFIALLRVFDALSPVKVAWLPAVQILAILSMIFGNILAISQTSLKRLLAYSSIAHAGYLMVAIASLPVSTTGHRLTGLASQSAIFYLFAYVFMTMGAFGVMVYLSPEGKEFQSIKDLKGLSRTNPVAAYGMMFFMLSLGGIPPTMGFMGKWQIFMSAVQNGQIMLSIVMALASVFAVYYYLRVVYMMTFEEPVGASPKAATSCAPVRSVLAISAFATIIFGLAPGWLISLLTVNNPAAK
ncbi:MAG: NADH-quinone oxidoreductase subunit N [Chthonomonadales bacterium]